MLKVYRASLVAQLQGIHLQCRRPRFDPWVEKILWRRERLPTAVFLPGEPHGQRSLVGQSPQGHKELDTTGTTEHSRSREENKHSFPSIQFLMSIKSYFCTIQLNFLLISLRDLWFSKKSRVQAIITILYIAKQQAKLYILSNSQQQQ